MSLSVDIVKRLRDITLKVKFDTESVDGITGILGSSGCGKSMTLKCIAGIETPDQGRIVLNGRVLFDSSTNINLKVQDRRVGYLFQNYALFPHMTVLDNVAIALDHSFSRDGSGKKRHERSKQAMDYLRMFHVEDLAEHYPQRLSGGQQQRVALARIMASGPDVLMLDEPFSALDYYLKENLQLELWEKLTEYAGDVLLVTHSRDEIYRLCSRIHVLDRGSLVVSGCVADVFKEPQVVSAARLTGCKNIVAVVREGPHELYVPEWNAHMKIQERVVPSDAAYIGIRAHYLTGLTGSGENGAEGENILPCALRQVVNDPFEVTLILDNGIWWKIPKEVWEQKYHKTVSEWVEVPEESVFFLRKDED